MCACRSGAPARLHQSLPLHYVEGRPQVLSTAARVRCTWDPCIRPRPLLTPLMAARILSPSGYKDRVIAQFDRRTTYEDGNTYHPLLAEQLIKYAALQPSSTVLDLACGTGLVTFLAAEAVGPQGSVLGLDISPGMLAQAERKANTLQLPIVSFKQGDAEQVDFAKGSFDAIVCSSALIYFVDVPAAIRKFRQWLQPGGKLVFNTPQEPFTPILGIMARLLSRRGIAIEDPAAVIANENMARQIMAEAGFSSVEVQAKDGIYLRAPSEAEIYAEFGWNVCSQSSHFPISDLLATEDLQSLREEFIAEAVELATSLQDHDGNVVDLHTMLYVAGYT